jgi:poly(glycerol-phosphate) alpha-glucosyltransferase
MYPSVVSLMLSRRAGTVLVISPHGMLNPLALRVCAWRKRLAMCLYEAAHLRQAACLRALCESEAASMRRLGLRNPICVVPNGQELPPDASSEKCQKVRDVAGGRQVLLFLGRLHPIKGLTSLLEAWAICQKVEPHSALFGNFFWPISGGLIWPTLGRCRLGKAFA